MDFKDILRISAKVGLIDSVEDWLLYRKMRNIASHTYDENKAKQIYQQLDEFMTNANYCIQQLSGRNND